jgi:hypothetical protein
MSGDNLDRFVAENAGLSAPYLRATTAPIGLDPMGARLAPHDKPDSGSINIETQSADELDRDGDRPTRRITAPP